MDTIGKVSPFIWVVSSEDRDREMEEIMARGASLTDAQLQMHRRGSRGYEIVRSIWGWYVRSDSGIDGWAIRFTPRGVVWGREPKAGEGDAGFADCLQWVLKACANTTNTAFVRRTSCQQYVDEMAMSGIY